MPLDILAAFRKRRVNNLTRNPDPRSLITAAPSGADLSQTTGRNRRNVDPALESAPTSTNPPAAATMS
jgi:hypothetical protein